MCPYMKTGPAQLLSDPLEGFYKNQERLTKEKLH